MPKSKIARLAYYALLIATVLFVAFGVYVTMWSYDGDQGWIAKSLAMEIVWIASIPFIVGSIIWTVALVYIRKRA